jgi:hypothetical protein
MRRLCFCLLAVLPLSALSAQEKPSVFSLDGLFRLAEGYLRDELTRRVGPAAAYEVRIDRQATNFAEGRLGPVEVVGTDVHTRAGLTVSRFELRVEGARLGADRKSLAGDLEGEFTAFVAAADLTRFARQQAGRRLEGIRVCYRRNELVLRGRPELLGLEVDSQVTGRPVIRRQGRVLAFRPTGLRIAGLELPDRAAEALADRLNPVVDLAELDVPLRLESATVSPEYLELRGRLQVAPQSLASTRDAG